MYPFSSSNQKKNVGNKYNKRYKVTLNLNTFDLLLSFGSNLNWLDNELTFRLNRGTLLYQKLKNN